MFPYAAAPLRSFRHLCVYEIAPEEKVEAGGLCSPKAITVDYSLCADKPPRCRDTETADVLQNDLLEGRHDLVNFSVGHTVTYLSSQTAHAPRRVDTLSEM